MKQALIVILVAMGLIGGLVIAGGSARFSDIEVSGENTFTASTWSNNPSLSLDPDDEEIETAQNMVSHSIFASNDGDELKDVAKNVELGVTVVKGGEFVSGILFDPVVGDIEAGGAREFSFTVELIGWENAEEEEEVKIRIKVTREDNRPEHNIGKRAHLTIIKDD